MVNDGGIHFPPKQRRDKPAFEPPPWERDQFEELATRKQELAPEDTRNAEDQLETEKPTVVGEATEFPAATQQGPPVAPNAWHEEAIAEVEKPTLDPRHMELLMMGLRSEEPQPQETYWKISVVSGGIMVLIGVMTAVWGLVALVAVKRGSAAPVFIAAVLLGFGIGFMAAGFWVVFRTLRQQGVL